MNKKVFALIENDDNQTITVGYFTTRIKAQYFKKLCKQTYKSSTYKIEEVILNNLTLKI